MINDLSINFQGSSYDADDDDEGSLQDHELRLMAKGRKKGLRKETREAWQKRREEKEKEIQENIKQMQILRGHFRYLTIPNSENEQ